MATPAELANALASQFEAAGNSRVASSVRSMFGLGGTTSGAAQGPVVQQPTGVLSGAQAMSSVGRPPQTWGPITGSGSPIGLRQGPQGPNLRGTFSPYAPPAPQPTFRPNMRMGFPGPAGADPTARLRELLSRPGQGPQGPNLGPTPRPAPPPGTAVARIPGRVYSSGPHAMGSALDLWGNKGGGGPGGGGGGGGAGGGRFGGMPPQGPGMRALGPGGVPTSSPFTPPAATLRSRMPGFRHPVADYRTISKGYAAGLKGGTGGGTRVAGRLVPGAAMSGGGVGKGAGGLSQYGAFVKGSPFAAKSLAFMKVANPGVMTAFIGDALGVNDLFEEGGSSDLVAEGLLLGASFGAVGGLPAALIGGAIGSTLNVLTGGALVDVAQKIPLVGGMFGSEEVYDITGDALTMFTRAATAQGNPELAAQAAEVFGAYNNLIKNGKLPEGSEMQYILQAGREAGLSGFPWEPEALQPVYSAEDLAHITSAINDDLRPMYDTAQGLMQQDFSHITDPKMREKALQSAEEQSTRIMEGIASALRGPTSAAMLGEANRPQSTMADQLAGGNAEFASLLAG